MKDRSKTTGREEIEHREGDSPEAMKAAALREKIDSIFWSLMQQQAKGNEKNE